MGQGLVRQGIAESVFKLNICPGDGKTGERFSEATYRCGQF